MKSIITLILLALGLPLAGLAQNTLHGTVTDSATQQTLSGASVRLQGSAAGTQTAADGSFTLTVPRDSGSLIISYLGYRTQEFPFGGLTPRTYPLRPKAGTLQEVTVSTGYQELPRERATGSFVTVDNALLNRSVSPDILSRLADVTSGLIFNRNVPGRANDITIRGQSTLFSNAQPLIVLDNFPYDGDPGNINPNDVQSITVLKDAAAASIWGTRAGNGVIVITTKKGKYNQAPQASFNTNLTIGAKPNLFYPPVMSTPDFIAVEKQLFAKGFYANAENAPDHAPLTPVVELLIAQRDGTVSPAAANAQLNALSGLDVRKDFRQYFYRSSSNQQYALGLTGGSEYQQYAISAGYDRDLSSLSRNGLDKFNFKAANTLSLLNHRLELSAGIYLTQSTASQDNPGIAGITMSPTAGLYPYAQLAGAQGNPLPITKDYRSSFVQQAQQQGLLNWQYAPLEELRTADNSTKITDYRLNTSISYRILPQLKAEALYLYERGITDGRNDQGPGSYYTRNLINSYTQVNPDGSLSYPIPAGGILDLSNTQTYSNDFRAQLNYNTQSGKNQVDAIAGYEIRSLHTVGSTNRLYGYDDTHDVSSPVDYITPFNQYYYNGYTLAIPYTNTGSDLADHNLSYYANAAYAYDQRFTLSGSARFDQSNLFGVKTNQKGVPLWSLGTGWNLSNESFYHLSWLPYLKLRLTYGENGNVNKNVSAYTTAYYYNAAYSLINQPYAQLSNPPDPELSWERIKIINAGLDFRLAGDRVTGSLEYYRKQGLDLIGSAPVAPSTGNLTFTGNDASTKGQGLDLVLHSLNLKGRLGWQTDFLLSYTATQVTRYQTPASVAEYLQFGYGGGTYPLQGKPLYAIYSYKWAGLDPQNGNPRGYLNGAVSEDYNAIIQAATPQNIVYNGPAQPTVFGSFRNGLSWGALSVSANISYRLGYYFRKNSLRYATVLRGQGGSGNYALRWQNPGDEAHTQVPSMPAAINQNRDDLYTFSSILVGNAGNIRLQDLSVGYDLLRAKRKGLPFRHIRLYLYANNLALLWKANAFGIDPDYPAGPPPKTIAAGLKADL
ncbi:MAG: TonB-dependent receptor plug [Mucilaginibacter sp.]|nr:TonB-dependent receptor plug [Mucilaginibacter sp.]